MKNAYRLFRRKNGYFYIQNNQTGVQKSLNTNNTREAKKLADASNEGQQNAALNLQLGRTFLAHADPAAENRIWQTVINEYCSRNKESTQIRQKREFRSKAYDRIRNKPVALTTSDDLRAVLKHGTKFTNGLLRSLHNFALGNGWLHWHIISPKQWPEYQKTPRRAVTQEEFKRIIAVEGNIERRLYYQMLWHTGASQTDGALLTAEMFDWDERVLRFKRIKTGQPCNLGINSAMDALLKELPETGLLFPKIAAQKDNHRAAQFCRRCKQLEIKGISLHSFRYSWAERAYAAGIPERFAQAALGHSSKAIHNAYARRAYVVCPALEPVNDKVVPLVQPNAEQKVERLEGKLNTN